MYFTEKFLVCLSFQLNFCVFAVTSCSLRTIFVLVDPCKDTENSLNTLCRVEALTRKPLVYSPPESCPPGDDPLCASDGHTYPNECHMTATSVQKGIKLQKIHAGQCRRLGKDTRDVTHPWFTSGLGLRTTSLGQKCLAWKGKPTPYVSVILQFVFHDSAQWLYDDSAFIIICEQMRLSIQSTENTPPSSEQSDVLKLPKVKAENLMLELNGLEDSETRWMWGLVLVLMWRWCPFTLCERQINEREGSGPAPHPPAPSVSDKRPRGRYLRRHNAGLSLRQQRADSFYCTSDSHQRKSNFPAALSAEPRRG